MKPVIAHSIRLASAGFMIAALVGCGVENTLGLVADAQAPSAPASRMAIPAEEATVMSQIVEDPGTPDDATSISGSESASSLVSGNGKDKPKKVHKSNRSHH